MGSIFGGSKQKSSSKNLAYDSINANYGQSGADVFQGGTNMLGNMLGLNGSGAFSSAVNDYWNSAGGKFQLEQGLDGLTSKFASMGLLKSGAAMKGMEQFRQGLASTYLNNYLGQLQDYSKLGLGAGSLVADAGQTSSSSGSSNSGGLGSFIGSMLAAGAMASDRRLKTKVEKVGEFDDGLGIYEFEYRQDNGLGLPRNRFRGVMADEVEKLRPWAFIPNFAGEYAGVNYGAL